MKGMKIRCNTAELNKATTAKRPFASGLMFFSILVLLITGIFTSANAIAANTLEKIDYLTLPGNRVQIVFKMSGPAEKPGGFSIDNPARIALDLANTKSALKSKITSVGIGNVRTITTVEAGNRTRAIINLTLPTAYSTQIDGNLILLTLDAPKSRNNSSVTSKVPRASSNLISKRRSLTGVDFRRGEKGEGRVIFTLSEIGIPSDIREENGKIIVEFLGTDIPKKLTRQLDVMDFATPIKFISTKKSGRNARVIITPITRDFEQLAYQAQNIFTVELKHIAKEDREAKIKERFGYTGERLSLNFQDIEVRSVLQLLADFTDLNIVVSDTVEGKLTLRLKDVPWDQALDIILKTKSLDKRKSGNVLLIAPTEEIAARERIELEAHQQIEELAPLKTAFLQINYAKAADLAEILKSEQSSILTDRATVTTDERTNTLLVHDTEEKLEAVRKLITKLDIPVRQVLIEARIVIATDDFNKELGVRFGVNRDTSNDGSGVIVSGNSDGITNLGNNDPLGEERFNVNLPVASSAGSIALALAKMPFGSLLELELSAMQAEGRGEVASSPRVITANQREAFIEQGVEIPYLEASSSGAATIAFRKAVLSLRVTPQITPDDRIIMDLTVNKDSVGELFGEGRQQTPSIDTREIQTQVLVNNGDTIVLGGIYEQTKLDEVTRVPFLSDLPLIGRLFKNTTQENDKTELLIFVTPKIVKDSSLLSN